jgi:hypothetical protein
VDDHNHALAALRYLVSSIATARTARRMGDTKYDETLDGLQPPAKPAAAKERKWLRYDNEALWRRIW